MKHFLTQPPFGKLLRTTAFATVLGACGVAGFFFWFDAQMCLFRAIDSLHELAIEAESHGDLAKAERLFREVGQIKDHQSVGPLFPGGLLPQEYYLEARADLARVTMERARRLDEARAKMPAP